MLDPLTLRILRIFLVLGIAALSIYLAGVFIGIVFLLFDVLLLFLIAWMLAYILNPLVRALMADLRISRGVAVLSVYFGLLGILVLLGLVIVPAAVVQVEQLALAVPELVRPIPGLLQSWQRLVRDLGIPAEASALVDPATIGQRLGASGEVITRSIVAVLQGVATGLTSVLLVLVLSYLISADWDRLNAAITLVIPAGVRKEVSFFFTTVDRTVGGFLRVTAAQMAILGLGTGLVAWASGVGYALPLGLLNGLSVLVPLVGPLVAMVPVVALAGLTGSWLKAAVVAAVLLALQFVIFNILGPRIMGTSIGLHPLLVLFALLAGIKVAGLWGALFGIPVAGILYSMGLYLYKRTLPEEDRSKITIPGEELDHEDSEGRGAGRGLGHPATTGNQGAP
jgi:predicted PurR-regulated permease PerM